MRGLFLFILLLFPALSMAQFQEPLYSSFTKVRPAGLDWQEIKTDHFRIIFPKGEEATAFRSAGILESQYPSVKNLIGGSLKNFPVVLNNYNDLSNGFVSSFNFRSEVEIPPFKGKSMNPLSKSWLENVLPHELVHASHYNVQQPMDEKIINIPNIVSLFSPDFARNFHGFAPFGVHEGIAVLHESSTFSGAGRGNYSMFTNWFNAKIGASDPWSMSQLLLTSANTLPFDRHYIGGHRFAKWLHDTYGDNVTRDAIRFHYSYFFLGYGYALRHVTGKWPSQLYNEFLAFEKEANDNRIDMLPELTENYQNIIDTPLKGERVRRPLWVNKNEIIVYGSFYNSVLGFYIYNIEQDSFRLLKETFTVRDFNVEWDEKSESLLYSSYQIHPIYPGTFITIPYRLNINTGKETTLSTHKRIYSPTSSSSMTLALRTNGAGADIVSLEDDNTTETRMIFTDYTPVQLSFNPVDPDILAVVLNKRGVQGVWLANPNNLDEDLTKPPFLAFDAKSVFDVQWHSSGERFLFTLIGEDISNIYEASLSDTTVTQLTSDNYNAFEASYSPDGSSIAFVTLNDNEEQLTLLNRSDALNRTINADELLSSDTYSSYISTPYLGSEIADTASWSVSPYSTDLSWIKPRIVLPVIEDNAGTTQAGVALSSTDVLLSQSYRLELTGIQDRLWYDLNYTNKTFYPGFEFRAFSEPDFFLLSDSNQNTFGIMRQERGFSLGLPFNYTFRGDTRLTSLFFRPRFEIEQFRYFDLQPNALSDFSNRTKINLFSQFNYNILRRNRDIQPISGLVLFGLYNKSLNSNNVLLTLPNGSQGTLNISKPWALYYGAFGYISPLKQFNQSLRLDLQFLRQSDVPVYNTSTLVPLGFKNDPFPTFIDNNVNNNLARFSTRYTIPLFFPDNGGLTVPFYLDSIYLTAFSHTLTDLNQSDIMEASKSIFGAGLHLQFKVSNLAFDIGIGYAYEPSSGSSQIFIGQF